MTRGNFLVAADVGAQRTDAWVKYARSIFIQAIGPISLFLLVWLLGKYMGPAQQAKFSELKSTVDLGIALLVFGFPQSVIYAVHKRNVERGFLIQAALFYGSVIFAVATVVLLFAGAPESWLTSFNLPRLSVALLGGMGIAGFVTHGILRGILLTEDDGFRFALITICPPLLLFGTLVLTIVAGTYDPFSAYVATGVTCALMAKIALRSPLTMRSAAAVPWRAIISNGHAVFMQSVFNALLPAAAFYITRERGGSSSDVAFLSVCIYLYQAGSLPITMVGPLLFNRWAGSSNGKVYLRSDVRRLFGLSVVVAGLGLIASIATPPSIRAAFGASYDKVAAPAGLMILAVPLAYLLQISSAILMSIGAFYVNTLIALARLILFIIAFYIGSMFLDKAVFVTGVYSWIFADVIVAICSGTYSWYKIR